MHTCIYTSIHSCIVLCIHISDLPRDARALQEEIFGPVLPVFKHRDISEVISFIQQGEKPLALYIFSKNRGLFDLVTSAVQSGKLGYVCMYVCMYVLYV